MLGMLPPISSLMTVSILEVSKSKSSWWLSATGALIHNVGVHSVFPISLTLVLLITHSSSAGGTLR
eukprot:255123-Pelagomonas_calceolata.AAC.1